MPLYLGLLDGRLALGSRFDLVVLGHLLLEGFDAFGDVPHQARNLVTTAKNQKYDGADDHPVPNAK